MVTRQDLPDGLGRYGDYGGRFVPETLMPAIHELEIAYKESITDEDFQSKLSSLLNSFVGRPTDLYFAENLTEKLGGAKIISRGKISPTQVLIRLTMLLDRVCWPSVWASNVLLPKLEQDNMELPLQLFVRC